MISLQFVEAGLLDLPILNLSDWFNLDKDLYKNQLLNVSMTGDLDGWIKYFCEAVISQSKNEIQRIAYLIEFREQLTQDLLKRKERGIIFLPKCYFFTCHK
jgi:Fic family protein